MTLLGTIRARPGGFYLEAPDGAREPMPYAFRAFYGEPLLADVGRRLYRIPRGLEMSPPT